MSGASFSQPRHVVESAWLEHGPFAFWLMDAIKPDTVVELGTHNGFSYFAFCQAAQQLGISAACYAVDTWLGDEHAGFYDNSVFEQVSAINDQNYSGFSRLLRCRFDEALPYFDDGTIDLLHIDGRHTYEDARLDFESWQPKLSSRAVVLFHDTNVRERDFGVWKLWLELTARYPSFEFIHGHGLGVLAFGAEIPSDLRPLFAAAPEQRNAIRASYAHLGSAIGQQYQLDALRRDIQEERSARRAISAKADELRVACQTVRADNDRLNAETERLNAERKAAWAEHGKVAADRQAAQMENDRLRAELADQVTARDAALNNAQNLQRSVSWRATAPLRAALDRMPHAMKSTLRRGAKAVWWTVTPHRIPARINFLRERRRQSHQGNALGNDAQRNLRYSLPMYPYFRTGRHLTRLALSFRFASFKAALQAEARLWRARRRIVSSGVFDADFYLQQFSDPPADPVLHYLRHGAAEGRWPHPLFDSAWYVSQNGDVKASGINPLLHYILTWKSEGRRINPFFDPRWYAITNADLRGSGLDPLTHYMRIGAARGDDPSPDFDTRWYLEQNGDVAARKINPLAHFLQHGRREGRSARLRASPLSGGKPVEAAQLHCLQFLPLGREVAAFVTHSPDGRLKPHLRHYLEALADEGIDIVLIIAADQPFLDTEEWLRPLVKGLFVRENTGLDFAAWAHLLRRHREIHDSDILYFLNDSLLGPTNSADFHRLVSRIRESTADIVGMTENRERGWHIQSYFLAIKSGALSSFSFQQFMLDVVSFENKDDVINNFEVQFSPAMISAGLSVKALYSSHTTHNPTIYHWRELLEEGFPFIKVMTVRDTIPGADKTGWREALVEKGYDAALADKLLADLIEQRNKPLPPFTGRLVKAGNAVSETAPRISFFGPWNYDNGLGFASRGFVRALMHTPFDTAFHGVRRPFHIHKRIVSSTSMTDFDGGADVAIVHMNPPWSGLLDQQGETLIAEARRRVGHFVWESTVLPDYFLDGLEQLDRIWVPTHFCAEAFRAATDKPVDVIPYVVDPAASQANPRQLAALRKKLGVSPDDRIILYIFDASSYLIRKNPLALVRAFERSGLAARGWKLVLKTKNLDRSQADSAELLDSINRNGDVALFDGSMSSSELATLLDLSDIYASSHSSEGFGLTIAEALARGKRVVATDYGGSRDFLTAETGFPVACREVTLTASHGAYARGTIWGQVDEDQMASQLVAAATLDDAAARDIREAAHRMIVENLSSKAVAARIEASLSEELRSA